MKTTCTGDRHGAGRGARWRVGLCRVAAVGCLVTELAECSRPARSARLKEVEILAVHWDVLPTCGRTIADVIADADTRMSTRERNRLEPIEQALKTLKAMPPGFRPPSTDYGEGLVVRGAFEDGTSLLLSIARSCDRINDGAGHFYEFNGRLFGLLVSDFDESERAEILADPDCRRAFPRARERPVDGGQGQ